MYYSYVKIEYVATSFSPARTDLALKLLTVGGISMGGRRGGARQDLNFGGKRHDGALVIWSPRVTRRSFGFVTKF